MVAGGRQVRAVQAWVVTLARQPAAPFGRTAVIATRPS